MVALKQQRLPRLRAAAQDLLDVRPEADVQHPVGLVEDHEADAAEHQRAAADQVHHAAGRADDDLRPAAKVLDLLADRLAAEDAHHVDLAAGGQLDALVADLDGQLAGGHEHQRLRAGALAERGSSRSRMGMQKAAVLPVPVCAWPIRSTPASACGISPAWIGVGSRYSASSRAASMTFDSPMPAKPAGAGVATAAAGEGFVRCRGFGLRSGKIVDRG